MTRQNEEFVQTALGRASIEGAKVVMTCNPKGESHWMREWLNNVEHNHLLFRLTDNPLLSQEVIDYYYSIYHGHFAKQLLEGEWASPAGLVYKRYEVSDEAWDESNFSIVDVACDWATSTVTAAMAIGYTGSKWVVFREYYHNAELNAPRSADEHAQEIFNMVQSCDTCVVDPSAAALRLALRRRGWSVRDGDNDIETGVQAVDAALTSGKLIVSKACPMTLRELGRFHWDLRKSKKGIDLPLKDGSDHLMDAKRYWVQYRIPLMGNMLPVSLSGRM